MKRWKDQVCRWTRVSKMQLTILMLLLILLVLIIMFFLTKEEEPQVTAVSLPLVNETYEDEDVNVLAYNRYEEVNAAIAEYYEKLAEGSEYTEGYEEIKVYTKQGKYKNNYVAFVTYEMKIPDIYTKVPGLETLYVYRDSEGQFQVLSDSFSDEITEMIEAFAQHKDVQALVESVGNEYQAAVDSDAMLRESLIGLQQVLVEEE